MANHNELIQNTSRPYVFLTGATGLLGNYILRDLLLGGKRVAVLVRDSRKNSAQQRIEALLDEWEIDGQHRRNVFVIPGSLNDANWVAEYRTWIEENCSEVIHSAASLSFSTLDDHSAEPWISNIDGTKNILAMCKKTDIKHFHYISTAYVGGEEEVFDETMTDVGQSLRNDYEKSKLQAEKLVRGAGFDSLTVYRPSIIAGDAKTGFTSTYHGFYAFLKLGHTLASKMPFKLVSNRGRLVLESFGSEDAGRKNFVPVDWVADVFSHIYSDRQYHGKTYHLTNPHPCSIREYAMTIQEAIENYSTFSDEEPTAELEQWFAEQFLTEMQMYGPYMFADPSFDSTNTQEAAPHLPCPKFDKKFILFLARAAIMDNFGKNRKKTKQLEDVSKMAGARELVVSATADSSTFGV